VGVDQFRIISITVTPVPVPSHIKGALPKRAEPDTGITSAMLSLKRHRISQIFSLPTRESLIHAPRAYLVKIPLSHSWSAAYTRGRPRTLTTCAKT